MSKLTIVAKYQSSAHFPAWKIHYKCHKACFLHLTSQEYVTSLIFSYIMADFRDICCDILSWQCQDRHWQIFQIQQLCMHTGVTFSCLWWHKLFIDEWRQYNLRVFIFMFVVQFAKFAKTKTSRKFLIQYMVLRNATTGTLFILKLRWEGHMVLKELTPVTCIIFPIRNLQWLTGFGSTRLEK